MNTFNQWLAQVNALLYDKYGVNIGDLPDEPFQDFFMEGIEPVTMVDTMRRNNIEIQLLE